MIRFPLAICLIQLYYIYVYVYVYLYISVYLSICLSIYLSIYIYIYIYIYIRFSLFEIIFLSEINLKIYQGCLSKSSNLLILNVVSNRKKLRKANITPIKEKSVRCTQKPFSKVLLSRLKDLKIRCISFTKGILYHRKLRKT